MDECIRRTEDWLEERMRICIRDYIMDHADEISAGITEYILEEIRTEAEASGTEAIRIVLRSSQPKE